MTRQVVRMDHQVILDWVEKSSSLLDLGCGNGELLSLLNRVKQVHVQGVEMSQEAIQACVVDGLSVVQQDIDTGLSEYADKSFDYVVLNQTFQQVKKPDFVLKEALRVGNRVIVGFPNFCYITDRFQIFFRGRVPVTPSLPYEWYDTPNLHFLSIADFNDYCSRRGIKIEKSAFLAKSGRRRFLSNLLAEIGLYLLSK